MTPQEALNKAIFTGFIFCGNGVYGRGPRTKVGDIVIGLKPEVREQLKKLTSDDTIKMRNILL